MYYACALEDTEFVRGTFHTTKEEAVAEARESLTAYVKWLTNESIPVFETFELFGEEYEWSDAPRAYSCDIMCFMEATGWAFDTDRFIELIDEVADDAGSGYKSSYFSHYQEECTEALYDQVGEEGYSGTFLSNLGKSGEDKINGMFRKGVEELKVVVGAIMGTSGNYTTLELLNVLHSDAYYDAHSTVDNRKAFSAIGDDLSNKLWEYASNEEFRSSMRKYYTFAGSSTFVLSDTLEGSK